ncbi:MAG: DUF1761 domain-containing protein [Alphaproteobacteria bacterium]|nr:DUF1761 domain-containing protein [Alphaproteobacteria bacterium]
MIYIALLLTAMIAFAIGAFWYHAKGFGTAWMQEQPHRTAEDYKMTLAPMVIQFLFIFSVTYMVFLIFSLTGGNIVMALMVPLLTLVSMKTAACMFFGHSRKMIMISAGYDAVVVLVAAIGAYTSYIIL